MSDYLGLEGKRALATGGTKGVGQAVVAALRRPIYLWTISQP